MPRQVKMPPVDAAKLIICELDIRDIESVVAYARYWLGQLKKRQKNLAQIELQRLQTQKAAPISGDANHQGAAS